ncbi:MAG: extracellular solute-binding protein [[Clostridium] scindens]
MALTFLDKHPEDEYKGYFEQAIADFEKAHTDIDIEYENISDQAIKEKLSVLAAGGDLPDIFFAWGGECLNRFSRAGRILDLTPYMEKDQEWRDKLSCLHS